MLYTDYDMQKRRYTHLILFRQREHAKAALGVLPTILSIHLSTPGIVSIEHLTFLRQPALFILFNVQQLRES